MNRVAGTESVDPAYKRLYTLGGVAAWLVVALTLSEVVAFALYPQPSTAGEWFELFQRSPLLGLLDFWGLEVPMYIMFTVVFLALYVVLRGVDPGLAVIALAFALLGVGIFLATNNPFSMLSLSSRYAAATTDAQRSAFLAAGEAILANTNQRAVGGFNIALFLVSIAGLIVSSLMFNSNLFGRSVAYVGLLAHGLSLVDYLRQALTSSVIVTLLVILPSALLVMVWFFLVGLRLYRLGRHV